jgi:hypothetical protein
MAGKFEKPPPLPTEILDKAVRVATAHGRSILLVSGFFAILAAMGQQMPATLAGVLVAGFGAMEKHGGDLLRGGQSIGLKWAAAAEFGVLVVVLAYAGWTGSHFDYELMRSQLPDWYNQMLDRQMEMQGVPDDQIPALFHMANTLAYALVGGLTVIYQGGMAIYYLRRYPVAQILLDTE